MSDATQIVIDVCYFLAGLSLGFFLGLVYSAWRGKQVEKAHQKGYSREN